MSLSDSEVRSFKATEKRQKKSCGDFSVPGGGTNQQGRRQVLHGTNAVSSWSDQSCGGYSDRCLWEGSWEVVSERGKRGVVSNQVLEQGEASYFFSCNRGLNGGKGNQQCSHAIRFSTLLILWNPPLYRKYTREKEVAKQFRLRDTRDPPGSPSFPIM